jgi:hypothetical protein
MEWLLRNGVSKLGIESRRQLKKTPSELTWADVSV